MKKSLFKVLLLIIICAFVVVGAMVTVSLINARTAAINHANTKLVYMSQKYAGDFNAEFSNAETIIDGLAVITKKEFIVSEYENDRKVFEEKKKEMSEIIRLTLEKSEYPIGIYLTFAPETSKGKDEIWFVRRQGGSIQFIDSLLISDGWLDNDSETTEYYYDAIKYGFYWSEAAYDPGNDGEVISYTKAVYDRDNKLIGVIGADIIVDDLFESLKRIDKKTGGVSALVEDGGKLVAGRKLKNDTWSNKHITASSKIGEKWEIIISQPVRVATESIIKTGATIIILGILIVFMICIFILYYSKRKVEPIIHAVEQKDLIMINQARQAKLGEMVGNIAHQWKQPLNGIRMALANMQDDYENKDLGQERFDEYMDKMRKMIDNLANTADDFTSFLKPGRQSELFSVNDEISGVLHITKDKLDILGITVIQKGPDLQIKGFRNEFSQCMFNLIDNARDALKKVEGEKHKIVIETSEQSNGMNVISVYNNGPHIEDKYIERLFDLYFSTKEEREGTGIGLYLVKEIVENHFNGKTKVQNVDGGVKVIIEIPNEDKEDRNS